MLRAESVRWGLAEAEKVYRDDPSAIVMLNVTELRLLLRLALETAPKYESRTVLGYAGRDRRQSMKEALGMYIAVDELELSESAKEAREDIRHGKIYRIVAEELPPNGRA